MRVSGSRRMETREATIGIERGIVGDHAGLQHDLVHPKRRNRSFRSRLLGRPIALYRFTSETLVSKTLEGSPSLKRASFSSSRRSCLSRAKIEHENFGAVQARYFECVVILGPRCAGGVNMLYL